MLSQTQGSHCLWKGKEQMERKQTETEGERENGSYAGKTL